MSKKLNGKAKQAARKRARMMAKVKEAAKGSRVLVAPWDHEVEKVTFYSRVARRRVKRMCRS